MVRSYISAINGGVTSITTAALSSASTTAGYALNTAQSYAAAVTGRNALSSASTVVSSTLTAAQSCLSTIDTKKVLTSVSTSTNSAILATKDYTAANASVIYQKVAAAGDGMGGYIPPIGNGMGGYIPPAAIGAGIAIAGATVVLPLVGFTSAGVAAGSIAASVQSGIGSVAAGSTFAILQSTGAAGMAFGTKVAIGTAGAVIGTVLKRK